MPYFAPESSYVLCSTIYLITIGVMGFAASRISAYRQQFQLGSNESDGTNNMQGMKLPTKDSWQSMKSLTVQSNNNRLPLLEQLTP